jgi:hypothetical protein
MHTKHTQRHLAAVGADLAVAAAAAAAAANGTSTGGYFLQYIPVMTQHTPTHTHGHPLHLATQSYGSMNSHPAPNNIGMGMNMGMGLYYSTNGQNLSANSSQSNVHSSFHIGENAMQQHAQTDLHQQCRDPLQPHHQMQSHAMQMHAPDANQAQRSQPRYDSTGLGHPFSKSALDGAGVPESEESGPTTSTDTSKLFNQMQGLQNDALWSAIFPCMEGAASGTNSPQSTVFKASSAPLDSSSSHRFAHRESPNPRQMPSDTNTHGVYPNYGPTETIEVDSEVDATTRYLALESLDEEE